MGLVMGDGAIVVRRAGASLAPDIDEAGRASHAVLLWLPAFAPPGSDGFLTLSCPLPERVPLWAADLRGPFSGLPRGDTSAPIIRTAVEGARLQLSMIVGHLERLMEAFASVRVTGAAFQSPLGGGACSNFQWLHHHRGSHRALDSGRASTRACRDRHCPHRRAILARHRG